MADEEPIEGEEAPPHFELEEDLHAPRKPHGECVACGYTRFYVTNGPAAVAAGAGHDYTPSPDTPDLWREETFDDLIHAFTCQRCGKVEIHFMPPVSPRLIELSERTEED